MAKPAIAAPRDSAGRQRSKRCFKSATAATKYRAAMIERAQRCELRTTRQTFASWFDEWLRGRHTINKATREDYHHGENRLQPFFGRRRLSSIDVPLMREWIGLMAESVEAGDVAPKTVNNALTCMSRVLVIGDVRFTLKSLVGRPGVGRRGLPPPSRLPIGGFHLHGPARGRAEDSPRRHARKFGKESADPGAVRPRPAV